MILFVAKRLLSALALLWAITFLAFMMLYPAAGDIARNILGEGATEEQVALLTQKLGLDQPLISQYVLWLGRAVTGDLGASYFTSQPVVAVLATRLPVTLSLIVLVTILTGLIGFALGTWAAVRRGLVDRIVVALVTIGDALPAFILALLFVNVFALGLGWFPATGFVPLSESPAGWFSTLLLPVAALTILGVTAVTQQVRSATIGVLAMDFVRTRRSRGLTERRVILTSVLRNSSSNGLAALAVQITNILGGSVIIELIFALPGLGSLVVESTLRADIPLILGILLIYVLIVVVINLIADIAVAVINPKVRLA